MGRLCREQPPPTTEWCLQPADTGPRATVAVMWAEGDFLPKVRGHVSRCQEHRAPSLFPSAPHTGAGGAWYLLGKRRAQMVPDSEPWPTPPPTNVGGSPSTGGPQQGPNPGSGCCTGVPRSSEVVNQPLVPPRDQVKSQCGWEVSARAQQGKHGSGAGSWGAGRPRQQQPWAFAHTGRQSQGEARSKPEEKECASPWCKGQDPQGVGRKEAGCAAPGAFSPTTGNSLCLAQARSDPQTRGPTAHLPSHGNAPGRPEVLQPAREGSFTHLQQPSTPPSIRTHPRCPGRLCLIRV